MILGDLCQDLKWQLNPRGLLQTFVGYHKILQDSLAVLYRILYNKNGKILKYIYNDLSRCAQDSSSSFKIMQEPGESL